MLRLRRASWRFVAVQSCLLKNFVASLYFLFLAGLLTSGSLSLFNLSLIFFQLAFSLFSGGEGYLLLRGFLYSNFFLFSNFVCFSQSVSVSDAGHYYANPPPLIHTEDLFFAKRHLKSHKIHVCSARHGTGSRR